MADVQSMFSKLVTQSSGIVDDMDAETEMVLAMSPQSEVALTATNTFNVNVFDLLKKNFPNIRFETAVQYGFADTVTSDQQVSACFNLMSHYRNVPAAFRGRPESSNRPARDMNADKSTRQLWREHARQHVKAARREVGRRSVQRDAGPHPVGGNLAVPQRGGTVAERTLTGQVLGR